MEKCILEGELVLWDREAQRVKEFHSLWDYIIPTEK
jgi:hypothetical protein